MCALLARHPAVRTEQRGVVQRLVRVQHALVLGRGGGVGPGVLLRHGADVTGGLVKPRRQVRRAAQVAGVDAAAPVTEVEEVAEALALLNNNIQM